VVDIPIAKGLGMHKFFVGKSFYTCNDCFDTRLLKQASKQEYATVQIPPRNRCITFPLNTNENMDVTVAHVLDALVKHLPEEARQSERDLADVTADFVGVGADMNRAIEAVLV
jgi:hypothetical protein